MNLAKRQQNVRLKRMKFQQKLCSMLNEYENLRHTLPTIQRIIPNLVFESPDYNEMLRDTLQKMDRLWNKIVNFVK